MKKRHFEVVHSLKCWSDTWYIPWFLQVTVYSLNFQMPGCQEPRDDSITMNPATFLFTNYVMTKFKSGYRRLIILRWAHRLKIESWQPRCLISGLPRNPEPKGRGKRGKTQLFWCLNPAFVVGRKQTCWQGDKGGSNYRKQLLKGTRNQLQGGYNPREITDFLPITSPHVHNFSHLRSSSGGAHPDPRSNKIPFPIWYCEGVYYG